MEPSNHYLPQPYHPPGAYPVYPTYIMPVLHPHPQCLNCHLYPTQHSLPPPPPYSQNPYTQQQPPPPPPHHSNNHHHRRYYPPQNPLPPPPYPQSATNVNGPSEIQSSAPGTSTPETILDVVSKVHELSKIIESDNVKECQQFLEKHSAYLKSILAQKDNAGNDCVHLAVRRGSVPILQLLIAHKANPETLLPQNKLTPLHCAVKINNLSIVTLLVEAKGKLNAQDTNGWTPVHLAVHLNLAPIIEYLAKSGADINAQNNQGKTPLHFAVRNLNEMAIGILLKYNANIEAASYENNMTPFHEGIKGHNSLTSRISILKLLISKGANKFAEDSQGRTAAHLAAMHGQVKLLAFLAKEKLNLKKADANGMTPFHHASAAARLDMVKYLVEKKVNLSIKDMAGMTALHHACRNNANAFTVISYLSTIGEIPFNEVDSLGATALDYAKAANKSDVISWLIERGAKENSAVNLQEQMDKKLKYSSNIPKKKVRLRHKKPLLPTHIAAANGKLDSLLNLLADEQQKITDEEGWNPAHFAAEYGQKEILSYLGRRRGFHVLAKTADGETAGHIAAKWGHPAALEAYLKIPGTTPEARDKEQRTVLISAAITRQTACIKVLAQYKADISARDNNNMRAFEYLRGWAKKNNTQTATLSV